jgi:hypothetical protein
MLQISYTEQEKGCPFDKVKLSKEQESKLSSYTANASATVVNSVAIEDFFEEFDMKQTQSGTIQIEQKHCLSRMTVFVGETISVISFSVSHMVADGFAYYRLLKSVDQEYQSPGSSAPLGSRDTVDDAIIDSKNANTNTVEENDAIDKFYPGMFFEQCFGRDLLKCHQLRSIIPSSVFAKMKAGVMPTLPKGTSLVPRMCYLHSWPQT